MSLRVHLYTRGYVHGEHRGVPETNSAGAPGVVRVLRTRVLGDGDLGGAVVGPLGRRGLLDCDWRRQLGGRGQRRALVRHGRVLHVDDPVEGPPATEQLDVHLALDIHEDQAPREADGHHDELGPEGPVQVALSHLFRRPVDEDVQRPDHACDRHDVERNGTEYLTLLHRRHLQLVAGGAKTWYLSEWLDLGVHDEVELAELAAARVGRLDPLL
ncbi:unnamed protein product, partial [Ixodes persulcatus]